MHKGRRTAVCGIEEDCRVERDLYVLESFRDEMLRKGRAEGRAEGREEGREEERQENYRKLVDKVMAKVEKGKSVTQIADELEEPISVIQPIYSSIRKEEK